MMIYDTRGDARHLKKKRETNKQKFFLQEKKTFILYVKMCFFLLYYILQNFK